MYPGLVKSTGLVLAEKPSIGIEPTNLPDRSRYGNHGTHTDITMVQLPSGLWVRSLNGSTSKIDCGQHTSLNLLTNFSLLVWIKATTIASADVISKRDITTGTDTQWVLQLQGDGALDMWWYVGGGWHGVEGSAGMVVADTWVLGAVVLGTDWGKTYINSVEDGSGTGLTMPTTYAKTVKFGGANVYLTGQEALPKILNYALSAGKIKQIYESERSWFGV